MVKFLSLLFVKNLKFYNKLLNKGGIMVIEKVIGETRDSRKRVLMFLDGDNKLNNIQVTFERKIEVIADNEYIWEETRYFNLYGDEIFRLYKEIAGYI